MSRTIRQRLEEAWELATIYSGSSYIAAAHHFVCHEDGSDCGDGCDYAADREQLDMLTVATELRDESMVCHSCETSPHVPSCPYREYLHCRADVEDLVRLWAARMVVS